MPIETVTTRLQWLDIAKGITIILMVMGHSAIPGVLGSFIYSFHMPLFFIASGITTKYTPFTVFFKKKSRGLIIPFVVYSVIVLALTTALEHQSFSYVLVNWLKMGWIMMALWFVPVLYISLFVGWFINTITNRWVKTVAVCLLPLLAVLLRVHHIWLPWNLSSVPFASFFIIIGYLIKPYCRYIDQVYKKWYLYLLLFIVTLAISQFWHLDMASNCCIPIIPLTVGALCGSLLVFCISKLIEGRCRIINRIFIAIGKETFVIMAFSQITIRYINEFLTVPFYVKYSLLVIVLMLIVFLKNKCINGLKARHYKA